MPDNSGNQIITKVLKLIEEKSISVNKVIVDVGANTIMCQSHSRFLLENGWKSYLIEPHPITLKRMKKECESFKKRAVILEYAIADYDGDGILYGHPNDKNGNKTANFGASLIENTGPKWDIKVISGKTLTSISAIWEQTSYYGKWLDNRILLLKEQDTDRIIGVQLYGIKQEVINGNVQEKEETNSGRKKQNCKCEAKQTTKEPQ